MYACFNNFIYYMHWFEMQISADGALDFRNKKSHKSRISLSEFEKGITLGFLWEKFIAILQARDSW